MSKKKLNNKSKKNRLEKENKKKNKIIKKYTKINLLNKRDRSTTNHSNLKAKKNQLRCHYCKLLMLRSNYARHLKLHDSNKSKKEVKIKKNKIFKESRSNVISEFKKENESSKEFIPKISMSDESGDSISSIENEENLTKSEKDAIPKISMSDESGDSISSSENEENLTKSEKNIFYNELSNFEENEINFIIKFGNIDFYGTIIYRFPNTEKYNIYTFPKSSFIWENAITKYDIPQLYFNRPTEFSIFSSISDIKAIKQFYITNHKKYILHEFSNIKKRYIEGIHIYMSNKSYNNWNILYKKLHKSSNKEDIILIEIFFPDEFPFEKPLINLNYYNIGFKNKFNNNYKTFIHWLNPHNTIEKLILSIKEIIDNTYKYYEIKDIDEEKKKKFEEKIKFVLENSTDQYKMEDYNINNFINKNNIFEQNKDIIKEDNIEPIPLTLYCNICKIKFIEYKSHIKSKNHMINLKKIDFKNIKETFKRIVKNNKK